MKKLLIVDDAQVEVDLVEYVKNKYPQIELIVMNSGKEYDYTYKATQISTLAKEYIHHNISSKDLNLKTTSNALHVGYHYLSKRFTEEEGISFIEYVTARRMDIACTLLTNTSLHVYEICEQIGWEPKNFHRIFYSKYQISPLKYRKLHTTK